jgi:FtsZ-interacting cell division protein YlmF
MKDIQKKLDELIQLREQLVQLVDTGKFDDAFSINDDIVYTGKIHVIAKNYQKKLKANAIEFNNLYKQSQQSSKESQRLAKESRKLAKESQRLAKESRKLAKESKQSALTNIKSYKNKNNTIVDDSIKLTKILISKIEGDIDLVTTELTDFVEMNKISSLCESNEFIQLFLETYLTLGKILFNDTTLDTVLFKIKSYCDWHYPGLQINPLAKEWIECMVATDPLYLINHESVLTNIDGKLYLRDHTVLDAITDYPIEYQRRLRLYTVRDQFFSNLPQNQFGVIACCDFLNFFNINFINNYLFTFLNLLRPGGNLVCTIQLRHPCVANSLVEQRYFNYTANLVIQKLFNNIGFEVISIHDLISDTINWDCIFLITAKKSGMLTTTKAHQALGSIIEK